MVKEKEETNEIEVATVSFIYEKSRENEWKEIYLALFEEELFRLFEGEENLLL